MADTVLEIGVLNIKASPHPEGVYPSLLKSISNKSVSYWGDDVFALKPPERSENGLHRGRIWIWTNVDPDKPAINNQRLEELSHDDAEASLRTDIGLNLRVFLYILRERDHLLFFEAKNELGQHLAPTRLVKVLEKLFLKINARGEMHVDVNVVPAEDALDKIWSIPVLTRLEIDLRRPNADDHTGKFAEIMAEMEAEGLKERYTILRASSPKKGITPSDNTRAEAEVAATNGSVRGVGKGRKKGEKFDLLTEEYPKIIPVIIDSATSNAVAMFRVVRDAIVGRRRTGGTST